MKRWRWLGISVMVLACIVLAEMVYQHVLISKMAVYPRRLPMAWKLLWLVPFLGVPLLGAACRTCREMVNAAIAVGVLRILFEFIMAYRNWPGHLKSYAIEAPGAFVVQGLVFFTLLYLGLLAAGYAVKCGYLEGCRRFRPASD